jgi:hypothetical protein
MEIEFNILEEHIVALEVLVLVEDTLISMEGMEGIAYAGLVGDKTFPNNRC